MFRKTEKKLATAQELDPKEKKEKKERIDVIETKRQKTKRKEAERLKTLKIEKAKKQESTRSLEEPNQEEERYGKTDQEKPRKKGLAARIEAGKAMEEQRKEKLAAIQMEIQETIKEREAERMNSDTEHLESAEQELDELTIEQLKGGGVEKIKSNTLNTMSLEAIKDNSAELVSLVGKIKDSILEGLKSGKQNFQSIIEKAMRKASEDIDTIGHKGDSSQISDSSFDKKIKHGGRLALALLRLRFGDVRIEKERDKARNDIGRSIIQWSHERRKQMQLDVAALNNRLTNASQEMRSLMQEMQESSEGEIVAEYSRRIVSWIKGQRNAVSDACAVGDLQEFKKALNRVDSISGQGVDEIEQYAEKFMKTGKSSDLNHIRNFWLTRKLKETKERKEKEKKAFVNAISACEAGSWQKFTEALWGVGHIDGQDVEEIIRHAIAYTKGQPGLDSIKNYQLRNGVIRFKVKKTL